MTLFLGLGIAGLVLLVLALVFDAVLEGLFDGVSALEGLFDGLLSLPVIAGFVSARYQAEQEAEARRIALVKQAEADAQRSRLTGEGEKAHRAALADAVRLEGEAEAAAIGAKGAAEAAAMQKKADAFAQYGDAAVLQMLVEVLPQVVAKASEPLSAIDKMTVISTDGASQLSRTVADNVAQGVELLSSTTGVDLAELLKNITRRTGGAQGATTASAANGKIEVTG